MNEDFVTYELAVKLKEKGFDEECLAYYTSEYTLYTNKVVLCDDKYLEVAEIDYEECLRSYNTQKDRLLRTIVDAPTISQVLKWLREEKKIYIVIAVNPTLSTKDKIAYYYQVYSNSNGATSDYYESEECYAQWEDCAIESIKSVLKYLI